LISFLRFIGVLNAAVWLGSAIFFTFCVGPGIFSKAMSQELGPQNYPYFSGVIAQILIARYFHLQMACGLIALLHLIAEWLYLGKPLQQLWFGLLLTLLFIVLLGNYWLQPQLKQFHKIKYAVKSSPEQRQNAIQSFRSWHGASQVLNLLVLGSLGIYLWRTANPPDPTRFVSTSKFRS
jgi:Domain of unknown function (DUF4149)